MLWKDFSLEIEEECVNSAQRARREITEQLNNSEIGAGLARRLQLIQSLFRSFMDEVGTHGDGGGRHYRAMGTDPLSMALGRLRGLVGEQIGEIAAEFDLDVTTDLAKIVPTEKDWFFEEFHN